MTGDNKRIPLGRRDWQAGFTLLELLVVLASVGILVLLIVFFTA